MKKYKNIFVLLFCLHSLMIWGQNDSFFVNGIDKDGLPLQYHWLQTSNPTSIQYLNHKPQEILFSYGRIEGDNRLYYQPKKTSLLTIQSETYKALKTLSFYGKLRYDVLKRNNLKWNDVLFISSENPFLFGDSIGGDYDVETFEMIGGIMGQYNKKLHWGIKANYIVGNSADQTDPRPLTKSVRYGIESGITYQINDWKLGADAKIGIFDEETRTTVLNYSVTRHYFLFMGLGNYKPASRRYYTRKYEGYHWAGNIQAEITKPKFTNLLQIGYLNNFESARDNGTIKSFKAGDYKSNTINLLNIFKLRTTSQTNHIFSLQASLMENKGIWYDQKQIIDENKQTIWEVYNKSIRYKNTIYKVDFGYSLFKKENYLVSANVEYLYSQANFYPEGYFRNYSNVTTYLLGNKMFHLKNDYHIHLKMGVGYRLNLSKDALFNGIKLKEQTSIPTYQYLTAPNWLGNVAFSVEKRIGLKNKNFIYPFLELKSHFQRNPKAFSHFDVSNRMYHTFSLGFYY